MRTESFVLLGIVLVVWLIAFLGSWLRQELEKQAAAQADSSAPAEVVPAFECERGAAEEVVTGIQDAPVEPSPVVARSKPKPLALKRFRYRSPGLMRRGVVLMTVFGPCKALDRSHDSAHVGFL